MWDGLPKPNFHGFMADLTGTNYNAICKVYGGDPNVFFGRQGM
jgi:hypothetical protein